MKKEKKERRKGRLKGFIKKHKLLSAVIAIVLVVAIVATGFALSKKGSDTKSYSFVRTTTLTKGTLEDMITATGTIKSASTSSVTTSLNYTIKTINVSVGDKVKKGDIICTLDTSGLESQIEKETSNLAKTKSSAQSSYNSAKTAYNTAKETYDSYTATYNEALSAYNTAKIPYNKAVSGLRTNQTAYDNALTAFNNAGAKYVTALNEYNAAVRTYRSKKTASNQSKLISAARAYMKAVQNYYGGCAKGTYDISDSSSSESTTDATDKTNNMSDAKAASSTASAASQSVTVTQTANDICNTVISNVKTLTGKTLSSSGGTNTLYKLYKKAQALQNAKKICNYSSLESAYTSAKSAYNEAKQTYSQNKDAVSQAKDQLDKAAEELENASSSDTLDELNDQLEDCSLKAKKSGTVTALNATVGSSVSMDSAVATIQDLENLQASITIEEADINKVELGMTCRVSSDASETTLNGELTQISPVSNEGSFSATVTINEKSDDYYIGMNASVDIIVSSSENVYQVPIDAVGKDDGESFVYRKTSGEGTDMQFEKVTVSTGESNDYYIEISSTQLNEGDVIRSNSDLSEGIETVSNSDNSSEKSGGLFASLFGGNKGGGDMPQGGGDMPQMPSSSGKSGSSGDSSSDSGMPSPPSGGFPGGSNG